MSRLLDLIYSTALVLLSPYILWRIFVKKKNRAGFTEKLLGFCPVRTEAGPCVWFHAVSVGEVKLLQPVIERLRKQSPDVAIAISSTTATGHRLAKQLYCDHTVFYSPLDFSWAIKRVLKRLRPSALVLAELELWPNMIGLTSATGVPVCVINGRLSEKSARRYQTFSFLVRPMFEKLSWVGAQSQHYAERFIRNGCRADLVSVTGSVKFDGVETDRNNDATQRLAVVAAQAGIGAENFVFVAGSTQPEEDLIAVEAFEAAWRMNRQLRLILVPRHPANSSALVQKLDARPIATTLRSSICADNELPTGPTNGATASPTEQAELPAILIVDVIGELSAWWGLADCGFVGGSMGARGGQSMIEPAGFAVPVCFGPNTENFSDTVGQLLDNEAAEVVQTQKQLQSFVQWSFQMKHLSTAMGERAQDVVLENMGAAERTATGIGAQLEIATPSPNRSPGNLKNVA